MLAASGFVARTSIRVCFPDMAHYGRNPTISPIAAAYGVIGPADHAHPQIRHPDVSRDPDFLHAYPLKAWVPASRLGKAEASLRRSQVAGMTEVKRTFLLFRSVPATAEIGDQEGNGPRKPALSKFGFKRTGAITTVVTLAALALGLLQRNIPLGFFAIMIARIDGYAHDRRSLPSLGNQQKNKSLIQINPSRHAARRLFSLAKGLRPSHSCMTLAIALSP